VVVAGSAPLSHVSFVWLSCSQEHQPPEGEATELIGRVRRIAASDARASGVRLRSMSS
jgi:hypothetical protein